jgi:riboflavin kinase/FMN adenylyltransferase
MPDAPNAARTAPNDVLRRGIGDPFPAWLRGGAVSVGNFDGVHRGHAALVAELRRQAEGLGKPAVVVTFDPHPLRLLAPERFMPLLTVPDERADLLIAAGANAVVILTTTPDLLCMEPAAFLDALLVQALDAAAVVEGFNFAFGRDRAGTTQSLIDWCQQFGRRCTIVRAKTTGSGNPVSSSRVRAALEAGDVAKTAGLLGRPYRLAGTVVPGERRGVGLGFPTANLANIATVVPGGGVYAARAFVGDAAFPAAANIGPNPTFGESASKVEVHLIGFSGDLYDQVIAVEFLDRLRDTRSFASKDALVRQLNDDVATAARIATGDSHAR